MLPATHFAALILTTEEWHRAIGRSKPSSNARLKPTLARAIERVRDAGLANIYVVQGTPAEAANLDLDAPYREAVHFVESIQAGLRDVLESEPEIDGMVIEVAGQSAGSEASLVGLMRAFDAERFPIVASEYDGRLGVPALVGRRFFEELLEDDVLTLFARWGEKLTTVSVPEAAAYDADLSSPPPDVLSG